MSSLGDAIRQQLEIPFDAVFELERLESCSHGAH